MSETGIILRTEVARIPKRGRCTRGVAMMGLKEGDQVASVARLLNGPLLRTNPPAPWMSRRTRMVQ